MKLTAIFALILELMVPGLAQAQSWPEKPVHLIVPYAAGGNLDTAARIVSAGLEKILGQPFVVENKPGAGGLIAGEYVANADADGYTVYVGANGPLIYSPIIFDRPVFNWKEDFVPIGSISFTPLIVQVKPSLEADTMVELIDLAKQKELFLGSGGAGSTNHILSERLQYVTGAKWTTVFYKGNAPALKDLLAGRVDFGFEQVSVSLPHVKSGSVRAIAVTSPARLESLPDVPTLAEQGFEDMEAQTFTGLLAPDGTDPAIVERFSAALHEVMEDPATVERFAEFGSTVDPMTSDEFAAYLEEEDAKWVPVIKRAGIKLE